MNSFEVSPAIYMPELKEPNYFSDDEQYRRGFDWYEGLFAPAATDDIIGEASTHYTKYPLYKNTIARMQESLVNTRFIYVMRHPIDRLVSHYIHGWTEGDIKCSLNEALDKHPELIYYGMYHYQLERYFNAFGKDKILPVFFDRLKNYPQKELERICRFIGYTQTPSWIETMEKSNVSNKRIRKFPLYNLLVESTVACTLRRAFIPKSIRYRIKDHLQMKKRPTLSEEGRSRMEKEFDKDLSSLGELMGIELCCENFTERTILDSLTWSESGI